MLIIPLFPKIFFHLNLSPGKKKKMSEVIKLNNFDLFLTLSTVPHYTH